MQPGEITLAPGLDVRGAGGYAIVPPSVHPSGAAYTFVDESVPIAPAPEWLLEMLAETSAAPETPVSVAQARTDLIPKGQRNQTLMSLAGVMRYRGMTQSAIEAALLSENAERCEPHLPEREVKTIARSALRYEPAPKRTTELLATVRDWPAPLGPAAFHGRAGEFIRLVGPETEADSASLLFSFLVTIIGRGPYYQVEGDRHYTNLFVVGESSKARKGTSWGRVRRFAELVDDTWCKQRVADGRQLWATAATTAPY